MNLLLTSSFTPLLLEVVIQQREHLGHIALARTAESRNGELLRMMRGVERHLVETQEADVARVRETRRDAREADVDQLLGIQCAVEVARMTRENETYVAFVTGVGISVPAV